MTYRLVYAFDKETVITALIDADNNYVANKKAYEFINSVENAPGFNKVVAWSLVNLDLMQKGDSDESNRG